MSNGSQSVRGNPGMPFRRMVIGGALERRWIRYAWPPRTWDSVLRKFLELLLGNHMSQWSWPTAVPLGVAPEEVVFV